MAIPPPGRSGKEKNMLGDILNAWVHHWGWLWMLVGPCGFIVFVAVGDN